MYVLAKFQLCIPKAFEVTALRSSSKRKIGLYSKHIGKINFWYFLKTDITYEWSKVRTQVLHHHVCHELRNGLLGNLFLLLPVAAQLALHCLSILNAFMSCKSAFSIISSGDIESVVLGGFFFLDFAFIVMKTKLSISVCD